MQLSNYTLLLSPPNAKTENRKAKSERHPSETAGGFTREVPNVGVRIWDFGFDVWLDPR
jgi:hypothetical protein